MALSLSGRKIDQDSEKNILINLIIDDTFCNAILPILDSGYLDLPYAKKLLIWIKEYHKKYKVSPGKHIRDIFVTKKKSLSPEDAELIEAFIESLNSKYIEDKEEEKRNSKYFIEQAIPYIEKQSYLKLAENISSYAKLDKLDEVKKEIKDHKKITELTSGCVNPHDPDFIRETFRATKDDLLFRIPGPLGTLIKPERGRLIACMAPPKTGKTFFLHYLGLLARMEGLKVFETNLEMSATKINSRDLRMITGLGDESKEYKMACIDCKLNQIGNCSKKNRASKVPLIDVTGTIPEFENADKRYVPCTACRGTSDFQATSWFFTQYKEELTVQKALRMSKAFGFMYGSDNYRLKAYPKFSATVDDIVADLDNLEYSSGFVPDVLIVDYADILKSSFRGEEVRHSLDFIWKELGRVATERNILVLTASQTNRIGAGKKNASGLDIAEAFTKVAHLDTLAILQCTAAEKRNGILRVSIGYNRDGDCDLSKQVMVCQNLSLSQPFLDSEWVSGYQED